MAIEDEIINIEDLEIAKEIKIGDHILLETTDGTKLIDFKDFIIGTDNITFYDKLSGGNFLQSKDISALEANFSTVSASVDTLTALNIENSINAFASRIQGVESNLNNLAISLKNVTNIPPEAINPFTNSKVGFAVSLSNTINTTNYSTMVFTKYDFRGSDLADGTDISLGSIGQQSKPTAGFFYKAKGAYTLLISGTVSLQRAPVSSVVTKLFRVNLANKTLFETDILNQIGASKVFNNTQSISFTVVATFNEGDILTIDHGSNSVFNASVRGITLY